MLNNISVFPTYLLPIINTYPICIVATREESFHMEEIHSVYNPMTRQLKVSYKLFEEFQKLPESKHGYHF